MTEALAALSFPVAAPTVWPPPDRSIAIGDPALVYVGSFLATVLQADCGAAWLTMDPGRGEVVGGVDGTRHGSGPVRRVFYSDPRLGFFEPVDLPALFVYRAEKATRVRAAADFYRRQWTLGVTWFPPRIEESTQRREVDAFFNAISASLFRAVTFARHPSWVLASEAADPLGLIAAPFATSTSLVTLTSFDGAMAGGIGPGRPAQVITGAAAGAYNITDPIEVTGLLDSGLSFTDRIFLTDTDGSETVIGLWSFRRITRVVIPEQLLATGLFSLGFYTSPDAKLGSLVQRVAGFVKMEHRTASVSDIPVRRPNDNPLPFRGYELLLDVTEELDIDLAAHGEVYDPNVATGITATITQGNNDPFGSFEL